jgi:hypothetical protein
VLTLSLVTVLASFSARRRRHGHLFGGIGTALGAAGIAAVGVGAVVLVVAAVVLAVWLYRRAKRR